MKCYCCKKEIKRGRKVYNYGKKEWGVLCRSCSRISTSMPFLKEVLKNVKRKK